MTIAVAIFEGQVDKLSPELKNEIIQKFADYHNWLENIDALCLFGNCLQVFTLTQIDNFLH